MQPQNFKGLYYLYSISVIISSVYRSISFQLVLVMLSEVNSPPDFCGITLKHCLFLFPIARLFTLVNATILIFHYYTSGITRPNCTGL